MSRGQGQQANRAPLGKLRRKGKQDVRKAVEVLKTRTGTSTSAKKVFLPPELAGLSALRHQRPPPKQSKRKQQPGRPEKGLSTEVIKKSAADSAAGGLYVKGDVVLLIGEGDFSFALALLKRLGSEGIYMVATVLDTAKELKKKYPEAQAKAKQLVAAGMDVKYGVDGRKLKENLEFSGSFTKVVFNFPHLGTDGAD
ncbi:unnamed protein product, partial [Polarella glacialis]